MAFHRATLDRPKNNYADQASLPMLLYITAPERRLPSHGSHMPLDTKSHWTLSNPLNVFPLLIVLMLIVALIAL